MIRKTFVFSFVNFMLMLGAQVYPSHDFGSPLDIPLILSATFGELRNNHFHSGLDIKTQGVEGKKVYAVAQGYVSRLRVSPYGYGKAIYITHLNGYTSVYGHLQAFVGTIATKVRGEQYKNESFELDLALAPGEIPVSKGEFIAYSGNSGGSGGPHVHFEIRETKTQDPINPMWFGYAFPDDKKPAIQALYLYKLSETREALRLKPSDTEIWMEEGDVGFGIETFDQLNHAYNKNGVYSIEMKVNALSFYHFVADRFPFADTRYINAHADYARWILDKQWINRCFILPGNRLPMYKEQRTGILSIKAGETYEVTFIVRDFNKNESVRKLKINTRAAYNNRIRQTYNLKYDQLYKYETENMSLYFPAHTFYQDQVFEYKKNSVGYSLMMPSVPAHKPYTLAIKPTGLPKQDWQRTVVMCEGKSFGGVYKNGMIYAQVTKLGVITLKADKNPPQIKPQGWPKIFTENSRISWQVLDDLSGIKHFFGKLDGKWVLVEYDAKLDHMFFNLKNQTISAGDHIFELIVTDRVDQTTYFKQSFVKK